MARQIIVTIPLNSGLGTPLADAFDMCNANFLELYNTIVANVTLTSQLTNDGADGVNPFITQDDVPTSWTINDVDDLQTQLTTLNNQITALNSAITNQNTVISGIQADIANIYSIINP